MEEDIQTWIKQARNAGFSDTQIRDQLKQKGWVDSQIDKLFVINIKKEEKGNKRFKIYGKIGLVIVVVVVIILAIYFLLPMLGIKSPITITNKIKDEETNINISKEIPTNTDKKDNDKNSNTNKEVKSTSDEVGNILAQFKQVKDPDCSGYSSNEICIVNKAEEEKNPRYCVKLIDSFWATFCEITVARALKDTNICKLVSDTDGYNVCLAVINQDITKCDLINIDFKSVCYMYIAADKKNAALCEQLKEVPSGKKLREANTCYIYVAQSTRDIKICDEIKDESLRDTEASLNSLDLLDCITNVVAEEKKMGTYIYGTFDFGNITSSGFEQKMGFTSEDTNPTLRILDSKFAGKLQAKILNITKQQYYSKPINIDVVANPENKFPVIEIFKELTPGAQIMFFYNGDNLINAIDFVYL